MTPPRQLDRAKVLGSFFDGDRLRAMPRPGRKRVVVLEHVAGWFEPGRRYSEFEVNALLRPAWADVAALRRYLVDEALLDRADGFYWRCGGPVDCGPPRAAPPAAGEHAHQHDAHPHDAHPHDAHPHDPHHHHAH